MSGAFMDDSTLSCHLLLQLQRSRTNKLHLLRSKRVRLDVSLTTTTVHYQTHYHNLRLETVASPSVSLLSAR